MPSRRADQDRAVIWGKPRFFVCFGYAAIAHCAAGLRGMYGVILPRHVPQKLRRGEANLTSILEMEEGHVMSLLKRILGKPAAFKSFSDPEKRQLLEFNAAALRMERTARSQGTSITFSDTDAKGQLLNRLSDRELAELERIRTLYDRADGSSGPEAIALYREVSQSAPWDEICLMSIGVEYAQVGQFDQAIEWLEKAAQVNPSNTRVRDNLMAVQAAGGRCGH